MIKRTEQFLILLFTLVLMGGLGWAQCSEDTQIAKLGTHMLGSAPVTGCTTDNDSEISSSGWLQDNASATLRWGCAKMTVVATDDITGVEFGVCDANADSEWLRVGIWPHDATYDEPDVDVDSFVEKEFAMSTITDCGDDATVHFFAFDSVEVNIGATTVWVCTRETNLGAGAAAAARSTDNGPTGRVCYSDTSTPVNNTNWTCFDTVVYRATIYGCSE